MAVSRDTFRTVTPHLVVPDADAELAFLKAAFDATEANCQRRPDNTVMQAEVKIGDSLVMLGQAGGPSEASPAVCRRCLCGGERGRHLHASASSGSNVRKRA